MCGRSLCRWSIGARRRNTIVKVTTSTTLFAICVIAISCCMRVPTADAQAPRADIAELLRISGVEELPKELAPAISQQFVSALLRENPNLSSRAVTIIGDTVSQYLSDPVRSAELVRRLIPIYASHFTPSDVQQLITFYKTAVGQKLAASLPVVNAQTAQAGQAWAAQIMPGLRDAVIQRLQSEGVLNR
jgi:hypothetical protein